MSCFYNIFDGFNDFNLPSDDPVINVLFSDANFDHLPADHKYQTLALLDWIADIVAEGLHDFGLAKSQIHLIDTGDAPLLLPSLTKKVDSGRKQYKVLKLFIKAGLVASS